MRAVTRVLLISPIDAGPSGASLADGMAYRLDDVACEGIRVPAPQRDQRLDPRVE